MRSKIIKKAHKRDDFKLTSHNFLLCIRWKRQDTAGIPGLNSFI